MDEFSPIIFFEKKPPEDDENYKPAFCDASIPDLPPPEPQRPLPQKNHFPFQNTQPTGQVSSVSPAPQPLSPGKKDGPVSRPKPYDVAMELMRELPLRMVDIALYVFNGQVYRFVSEPVMNRIIMHTCRQYVQAVGDALIIDRVYKLIQAEPNIVCKPDRNTPLLVADQDGLIDLQTFAQYPYSPAPFVTTLIRGSFSRGRDETCPVFDQFLLDVSGGDPLLIARIWEAIGYALTPDTAGKCFILLQGVSDSGKSLLGDIIASLLDEENVTSLDLNTLGERFGTAELVGKQLCLSLDMPSGVLDPKATSMLKSLTGGDIVTADVKYQARIKFRCSATFLLASNHALLTRDHDPALLGRAVTIPFRYSVSRERQDHHLRAKILAERNAIIFRALLAYQRLKQNNYRFSGDFAPNESVDTADTPAADLTAKLWAFLRERCVAAPDHFITTTALYDAFCSCCKTSWPGGIGKFSSAVLAILEGLYPQEIKKDRKRLCGARKNPERGFTGIALAEDMADEEVG